ADVALAGQSLNSVVYGLHRLLGNALGGAPPVLHSDGWYRLNLAAGVAVDVQRFETLASTGEQQERAGNRTVAVLSYGRAVSLYAGDLRVGQDISTVVERERLRALYLTLLVRLADAHLAAGDFRAGRHHAERLLAADPCREDAHRLLMLC